MRRVFELPGFISESGEWRPPRGFVLGVLYVAAGLLALFAAALPLSDEGPTTQTAVIGSAALLAGLPLLLIRRQIADSVILAYSVCGILALSFLIANGETQLGIAIAAMPYLWFCAYLGTYMKPAAARSQIALICLSFGIALLVSDVPASASLWVVFSATMVVTTEALLVSSNAMRHQARLDPLTGLLNRRGLEEAAGPVFAIGERIGRSTSIAIIDLDGFKRINDEQGHLAGDRILAGVAAAWSGTIREADLLARYGGDEFVVVMPATGETEAEALIERLKRTHPAAWSFGIAKGESGDDFASVLERADRQLYEAKRETDKTEETLQESGVQ